MILVGRLASLFFYADTFAGASPVGEDFTTSSHSRIAEQMVSRRRCTACRVVVPSPACALRWAAIKTVSDASSRGRCRDSTIMSQASAASPALPCSPPPTKHLRESNRRLYTRPTPLPAATESIASGAAREAAWWRADVDGWRRSRADAAQDDPARLSKP